MLVRFLLKKLRGSKPNPLSDFIVLSHTSNCSSGYLKSTCSSFSSATQLQRWQTSKDAKFTVSYLVDTLGFALDSAECLSTKLSLKSADKPDAVLKFFKDYGFSETQIASIVRRRPKVLLTDPERFLKPKVEIFSSFGAPPATVAQIVDKCPAILTSSVENRLLPSLKSLKSLVLTDSNVVSMMLRFHNLFNRNLHNTLRPNVATLREVGVSESVISKTISHRTHELLCPSDSFRKAADKVKGMGFDLNKFIFVEAVIAITTLTDDKREQRCSTFRKWGWSDADLENAFLKHPAYMVCAEKKIDDIMDFLVNYMGFTPSFIAEIPWVFKYRKERIVARYSLIKTLIATGVVKNDGWKPGAIVIYDEQVFLQKFLTMHETAHPELSNLYLQSKKDGKPF
ncbi:unnamed protein product [Rhodiola kirilowii]